MAEQQGQEPPAQPSTKPEDGDEDIRKQFREKLMIKKLYEPLVFTLLLNLTDTIFQVLALLNPLSKLHFYFNSVYMVNSFVIFVLLLSAQKKNYQQSIF